MEDIWLVGEYLPLLTDSEHLPTYSEVFRRFMFLVRAEKNSVKKSATLTVAELKTIWKKKNLTKFINDRTSQKKLMQYYNTWKTLTKSKLRTTASHEEQKQAFLRSLTHLFDIGKDGIPTSDIERKAVKYLKSQRERDFAQLTEALSCSDFESQDSKPFKILSLSDFESSSQTGSQIESVYSLDDQKSDDKRPGHPKSNKSPKLKKINVITMEVAAVLDRYKVSDRAAFFLISSIAKALGQDVSRLVLNKESIRKSRAKIRRQFKKDMMKSFKPDVNLTVHWDSKLLPNISPSKALPKTERLAIVVSGEGVRKLLAVPPIHSSTGMDQAEAVYKTVIEWGLKDRIMFTSFDTTASNTGRKNGACQILDKLFERKLLGLPCRHHIFEILVGKAFKILNFEASSSPNVEMFKDFQYKWLLLDRSSYHSGVNNTFFKTAISETERLNLLSWFTEQCSQQHHREDYREVLQLAIVFLGGVLPDNFKIRAPGAYHKARWMAKIIYCLKMYMFRHALSLTTTTKENLERFNVFIVKIYLKSWFLASCAAMSPKNDLDLLKCLKDYETFDKEVAAAVTKGFLGHLQYLDTTLIGLSLFDKRVTLQEKQKIISALKTEDPQTLKSAKAIAESTDVGQLELHSFVQGGAGVKAFLQALEIANSILELDVANWSTSAEYEIAQNKIKNLEVVNDNAERGIALIKTFNSKLTTDEDQKQCVLQIIEEHRKLYKSPKKSDIINPMPNIK